MRKLSTSDLFSFSRLIVKIGLKNDILELTEKASSFNNMNDLGYEFFFRLFTKATSEESEKLIYDFLAKPFEISADQVALLPLDELMDDVKNVISFPQLAAFLKRAVTLMRQ